MITITTIIAVDKKDWSLNIGFSGKDNGSSNTVEVAAADRFRAALKKTRDEIFEGGNVINVVPESYTVEFKNPDDRDRHMERLK